MIEQPCGYLNRRAYTHLNTEIKNSTYVGLFVLMFTSYYQLYPRHDINQGCNVRKVNCGCVYSAYILKPVLSGWNL